MHVSVVIAYSTLLYVRPKNLWSTNPTPNLRVLIENRPSCFGNTSQTSVLEHRRSWRIYCPQLTCIRIVWRDSILPVHHTLKLWLVTFFRADATVDFNWWMSTQQRYFAWHKNAWWKATARITILIRIVQLLSLGRWFRLWSIQFCKNISHIEKPILVPSTLELSSKRSRNICKLNKSPTGSTTSCILLSGRQNEFHNHLEYKCEDRRTILLNATSRGKLIITVQC